MLPLPQKVKRKMLDANRDYLMTSNTTADNIKINMNYVTISNTSYKTTMKGYDGIASTSSSNCTLEIKQPKVTMFCDLVINQFGLVNGAIAHNCQKDGNFRSKRQGFEESASTKYHPPAQHVAIAAN